ncbi:MAG TPA: GrlR family regulatory protein [Rhodanobacteraceae bacterium]
MIDGIYRITFFASSGDLGDGMIVIKEGKLNGADNGYLYLGSVESRADGYHVRMLAKRWDPNAYSAFGPLEQFELVLDIEDLPNSRFILATGHVVGQPHHTVSVRGRFLSDPA